MELEHNLSCELSWTTTKLTAVPFITSIRACPDPTTSCKSRNALTTGTPKLGGAATCLHMWKWVNAYASMCTYASSLFHMSWLNLRPVHSLNSYFLSSTRFWNALPAKTVLNSSVKFFKRSLLNCFISGSFCLIWHLFLLCMVPCY